MNTQNTEAPSAFKHVGERDTRPAFAVYDRGGVERSAASQLRADLAKSRPFETGTIIAWDSLGAKAAYSYAAIYAAGRWYTTIAQDNPHVQRVMTHEELMTHFTERGDHIANLRVATGFEGVGF